MNVIDRFIGVFSPSVALKRVQNRAALEVVRRGFEAARRDRRTKGWRIKNGDDQAPLADIQLMRIRSKDLYRNNPYAYSAHGKIANNAVGVGIIPAISDQITKQVWSKWADSIAVDFDGHFNFYGLQHLATKTMSIQGECLVLRIWDHGKKRGRVPLELKVLSAKYLDLSRDVEQLPGKGYVSGGIEYDANGKRKGYWLFPSDPKWNEASVFWPDEDVIHLFMVDEPGQNRGYPMGVPSVRSLRDYDDYADAQLMRQKVAACFAAFVEKSDITGFELDEEEDRLEKIEPGMIEYLEPGKKITFASPPATDGYGEYSRNVLTSVASGFGVTYEAMTGDLSNVNFSSGRMGWIEMHRNIEVIQWHIIIPKLCYRVYEWFREAAILAGLLSESSPEFVEWTAPRRQMIDPVKETKGLVDQVRAGFKSWQEAVRELGYMPEEILEELKSSAQMFDEAGLKPDCDPRFDKQQSSDNGQQEGADQP